MQLTSSPSYSLPFGQIDHRGTKNAYHRSRVSAKRQEIQDYLYQKRVHGLAKTPLPQFLYTLASQQQSRGSGSGSGAPGSSSAGFPQFGLGGSHPAGPGAGAPGAGGRRRPDMTIPMPTDAETFSMTSYNENYIDGIQIWRIKSNGQPECLRPGDPRFDIMAAAIMLGFDIMESQPWRRRMRQHADSMFEYIQQRVRLPLPPGRIWSDEFIRNYSEDFIRRCRQNSPIVILNDLGNSQWARTLKADWSGRGFFNPQLAATVEYNIQVMCLIPIFLGRLRIRNRTNTCCPLHRLLTESMTLQGRSRGRSKKPKNIKSDARTEITNERQSKLNSTCTDIIV